MNPCCRKFKHDKLGILTIDQLLPAADLGKDVVRAWQGWGVSGHGEGRCSVGLLPGEQNLKKDNNFSFNLVVFKACEIVNLEPEA